MARENFSIGALYNITKNQHNPIKTVGQDSFLSPKTPKNTSFLGVTQPPGVAQPLYSRDTTRPRRITCVLVWSTSDQRRLRKTVHKQTNRQTNRHYENNGHLAVNQLKTFIHSNICWNIRCHKCVCTSLWGLGGVDKDPTLTSVLSSNVAGIVTFSSSRTAGVSVFGFLGGRPSLRPDFGCDKN